MSRSRRHRETSSGDNMALNPNSNRPESYAGVGELLLTVGSSSNEETEVRLNGRMNLRSVIQPPEVEVTKIDSMIKLRSSSVASFTTTKSEKKDEVAAGAINTTNQFGYPTVNGQNDEKQGILHPFSVTGSNAGPLDGLGNNLELVKTEGGGETSWNSGMLVNNRGNFQPPLAHATKEQEFQSFLEMDAAANRMDRSRNLDSNSNYIGPSQPFSYIPLEGESLLRRALTGKSLGYNDHDQYNGVKSTAVSLNSPLQNGTSARNEEDNSDVDVEVVDDGRQGPMNLAGLIGPDGANVAIGSERAARKSTVQKRKLSPQFSQRDGKKGFSRAGNAFDRAEKSLAEMSKQTIWAFVQKESKKPKPDFSKLSEALDLTYDTTRKILYDRGLVDVKDFKKKYPALLHYQMVKEELGRILKDPRKMERLENELTKAVLASALEGKKKTLCPGKKRHPIWKKSVQLWEENKGNINSAEYRKILGMIAVCFEFAENSVVTRLCKILKQNEKLSDCEIIKMDVPVIVVRDSQIFNIFDEADIWIYVDGQKYIKVPNMYEAVLTVFASYYIFNIAYDKSLKSLFEFFDYLCDNPQTTYPKTN